MNYVHTGDRIYSVKREAEVEKEERERKSPQTTRGREELEEHITK